MRWYSLATLTLLLFLVSLSTANANYFSKCYYKVVVKGAGIGTFDTTIKINGWGRAPYSIGRRMANAGATRAVMKCSHKILKKNYTSVPTECKNKSPGSANWDHGIFGFTSTDVFKRLKRDICRKLKPKPQTNKKRQTYQDFIKRNTHQISGFMVFIKKRKGRRYCKSLTIVGPKTHTIKCNLRGTDTANVWYHR